MGGVVEVANVDRPHGNADQSDHLAEKNCISSVSTLVVDNDRFFEVIFSIELIIIFPGRQYKCHMSVKVKKSADVSMQKKL